MKLLILGLILICALIIQIILINKNQENFVSSAEQIKANEQNNYLNEQDKYYDIRSQHPKAGTMHTKPGINTWFKLDINKKLKEFIPKIGGERSIVDKNVQNCRQITDCSQLNNGKCGYCAYDKEFRYGDKKGPKADVCPGKAWTTDPKKCEELREKEICSRVKSCGDLYGEAERLCGYCPTTGTAMPMKKEGNKWVPKYDTDTCSGDGYGLLPGDKCAKFLKDHPCVTPNHKSGPHSEACIKKLWKNSQCTHDKVYFKSFSQFAQTTKKPYKEIGATMMNTNTKTRDNVYSTAVQYSDLCFGNHNNIDPCDMKYARNGIPHPECLKKKFLEVGCTTKGTGWRMLNSVNSAKNHVSEVSQYKIGADAPVNAVWRGWNERAYRGKIKAGQGDCDNDRDCAPGLKCGHDTTKLPGVTNTGAMGRGRDFCYKPSDTTGINEYKNTMKNVYNLTMEADKYSTRKHTSEICLGEIPPPPPPLKPGDRVNMIQNVTEGSLRFTGIVISITSKTAQVMWIESKKLGSNTVRKREKLSLLDQQKYFGWDGISPTINYQLKPNISKRRLNIEKSCSPNKSSTCKMTCKATIANVLYKFPRPRDCVVGQWGGWSSCSKKCDGGSQTRTRSVLYPAKFGGNSCPTLRQTRSCNTQACLNPNFTPSITNNKSFTLIGNRWAYPRRGYVLRRNLPLFKTYEVTFRIIPRGKRSGWTSLFSFGVGSRNYPRLPGVWFHSWTSKLHIRTSSSRYINDGYDPNVQLPIGRVTTVSIKVASNTLAIGMSGGVNGYWSRYIGPTSLHWGNTGTVYFGSPHYHPANVQIKDLVYAER